MSEPGRACCAVLLVEEDPDEVESFERLIACTRFAASRVIVARGLAEAMEEVEERTFDVAVIDVGVGGNGGMGVLRRLRRVRAEMPIVVLTNNPDGALTRAALGEGAGSYLMKGRFDAAALDGALSDAVEQARLASRLEQRRLERLGMLTNEIARELESLLTPILVHADLIGGSLGPGHPEQDRLHEIRDAVARAAGLARKLFHIELEARRGFQGTFPTRLPAAEVPNADPCESAGAVAERSVGHGTVLLVEDDEAVRRVTVALLERLGMRVIEAQDGHEAVSLFEQRSREVDAVLLDLTLPHLGGEATLGAIRTIVPDVPVVICSGHAEEDIWERLRDYRPAGLLPKPYDAGSLRNVLGACGLLARASP